MSGTFAPTPVYAEPERGLPAGPRAARATDNLLLRRWFGCWIDFLAAAVVFVLPGFVYGALAGAKGEVGETEAPMWLVLLSFVAPILYYLVAEGAWGRSLGKLATGLIVVDKEGGKAGWGRIAVRTLLRIVEVNPFFLGGLPAGLAALFTKNTQRLGDLAAGTYVVSVKTLGRMQDKAVKRDLAVFD